MSEMLAAIGPGAYAAMAAIAAVLVAMTIAIVRLSRSEGGDRDMRVFLLTVGPAVLVGVIAMAYLVATLLWIDAGGPPALE